MTKVLHDRLGAQGEHMVLGSTQNDEGPLIVLTEELIASAPPVVPELPV
jgi:hypothetical protein